MLSLFNKQTSHSIGIDISSTSIRWVELARQPANEHCFNLVSWSNTQRPSLNKVAIAHASGASLSSLLASIITRHNSSLTRHSAATPITIAVDSADIITKTLTMPSGMTAAEIEEQVIVDAMQFIPHSIEAISFDFDITNHFVNKQDVLLVACHSTVTNELISDFKHAVQQSASKLELRYIDVDMFALQRTLKQYRIVNSCSLQNAVDTIVHLKHETGLLILLDSNGIIDTQTFSFQALPHNHDLIVQQLALFNASNNVSNMGGLLLCGEHSNKQSLIDRLAQTLSLQTPVTYSFISSLSIVSNDSDFNDLSSEFALAYGLALKGMSSK